MLDAKHIVLRNLMGTYKLISIAVILLLILALGPIQSPILVDRP
jgi:hypothetical protein